MKAIKLLMYLCVLQGMVTSCETSPVTNQEKKDYNLKSFLTDNYSVGNSLLFIKTDLKTSLEEIVRFDVIQNDCIILNEVIEPDDDAKETGNENFELFTAGYKVCTIMQSAEYTIRIELRAIKDNDESIISGIFDVNNKSKGEYQIVLSDDYISIIGTDRQCVMQKGIGVVSVIADNIKLSLSAHR